MAREQVTLDLHWHAETTSAILVSENGNDKDGVWLPKSQVEYRRRGASVSVTLPEWLATRENLV